LLLALMRTFNGVATQLGIPYFVIGATARDILLEHVYGIASTRATRDIDFAVAVPSWDVFDILKTQLISTGGFIAGEAAHRLLFGMDAGAYPLDLVPFAGVERDGEIAWPPDGDFVMNIAGYADAHASALAVAIAPERDKHASDVVLLLRHYHEAGQFDRLYDDGADLLAAFDYDIELAGAALLGRDAQRDVAPGTCKQVHDALADERKVDKFIAQARRSSTATSERAMLLINAFLSSLVR
jgi:predicted nucleotidyltransferase